MNALAANLAMLIAGLLGTIGPVALLLMLMYERDRRKSRLYSSVILELNRPHLRGNFTVKIRSWPFMANSVRIRFWDCSRDQV